MRIRPGLPVKQAQRYSAPLQVESSTLIAVDLDMQDDRLGLLNPPNAAQLDGVAETGRELSRCSIGAEVSGGHAGQGEENSGCSQNDQSHKYRRSCSDGEAHGTIR